MMKKLVRPGDEYLSIWDSDIRPVVQESFREISGGDSKVDVVELEQWLKKDWESRLAAVERRKQQLEVEQAKHHREHFTMDETMNAMKKGRGWLQEAQRKNRERLAEAARLHGRPWAPD